MSPTNGYMASNMEPLIDAQLDRDVGAYRSFSTHGFLHGADTDIGHIFFPLSTLSGPMRVAFVAAYLLLAGRVWWVTIQQPQWYLESLESLGIPPWFAWFANVPPSMVTGPLQIYWNWQLSMSPDFIRFMQVVKEEYKDKDDKFREDFHERKSDGSACMKTSIWDYLKILGSIFVLFGLLPAVVLWYLGVADWQWFSFSVTLSEGVRMFLVQSSTLPLQASTCASSCLADRLICRILGNPDTSILIANPDGQWNTPQYWQGLCEYHREFTKDMIALWKIAAIPLALSLLECGVMCLDFVLAGLLAHDPLSSYACFGMSSMVGMMMLHLLYPMAIATKKCQSMGADMSIRKAADEYIAFKMDTQTLLEYTKFTDYLGRTPTGVSLPLIGQVNFAFLASKGILLATAFPAVLTFVNSQLEEHVKGS